MYNTSMKEKGVSDMSVEYVFQSDSIQVYKKDGKAFKVFHPKFQKSQVFYEAMISAKVESTRLNIPKVRGIFEENGSWVVVYDFIEGKTLAQLMQEQPEYKDAYLDDLVELQLKIHSVSIPDIIKLKHKLQRQINSLDVLDNSKKYELLTKLEAMPKHSKLCHGNFGPENVIVTDTGMVYLLDWVAASRGNASADVARTYLKLALYSTEDAEKYMKLFCEKTGTSRKYVQEWLPIMAASQLAEGAQEKRQRELLFTWLDVMDFS